MNENQSKKLSSLEKIDATVRPCSSKATSVIRLASQKSPKAGQQSTSDAMPKNSTATVKVVTTRTPKKLVVKLKKPFIPVIEEEANLHPPEQPQCNEPMPSCSINIKKEIDDANDVSAAKGKEKDLNLCGMTDLKDLNLTLECSEDVPFSPMRQSYTPLPRNENEMPNETAEEFPSCSNAAHNEKATASSKYTEDNNVVMFEISILNESEQCGGVALNSFVEEKQSNDLYQNVRSTATSSTTTTMSSSLLSTSLSSASTSSSSASSSSQSGFNATATTSRSEYGMSSFLSDQSDGDYLYSTVRLSPLPLVGENGTWNQRFSPSYTPFELDKQTPSYADIDACKTSSNAERAPSRESLNIRTDEKMPAKGEISEQESNGDIEGSWSHQVWFDFLAEFRLKFSLFVVCYFRCIWTMTIYRGIQAHMTQRSHEKAGV